MNIRAELSGLRQLSGIPLYQKLGQAMIELALARPDGIEGNRAGDWGPVFATIVKRLPAHDAGNLLQSLSLLPTIPASLAPVLVEAGAVDLLERLELSEGELCRVARKAPAGKLVALAARTGLPASTSNLIVARGNCEAHAALARNLSARIGASCFGTLAELAYGDMALKEALVARPDLPPAIFEKLWPYLSLAGKKAAIASAPAQVAPRIAALMGEEKGQRPKIAETTHSTTSRAA